MAQLIFRQRSKYAWEPAAYGTDEIFTAINVSVGDVVGGAFMRITEVFNGTTGDATLELGDASDTNRFMTTANCGATVLGLKEGTGAGFTETPGYLYTAADTVDVNYVKDTSADGTTGICDAWIYVAQAYPH
jgi:hypothetical protein